MKTQFSYVATLLVCLSVLCLCAGCGSSVPDKNDPNLKSNAMKVAPGAAGGPGTGAPAGGAAPKNGAGAGAGTAE